MLINLSNHPSSGWSDKQRGAAIERFGEITDMPFPAVPPEASSAEIDALTWEYFTKIAAMGGSGNTVHAAGEFTFTYMLLKKLEQAGIPAVCSTTRRNPDGKGEFEFIAFREYFGR